MSCSIRQMFLYLAFCRPKKKGLTKQEQREPQLKDFEPRCSRLKMPRSRSNTTCRVYMGNLSSRAHLSDVKNFFRRYARRFDILMKDGFAFIVSHYLFFTDFNLQNCFLSCKYVHCVNFVWWRFGFLRSFLGIFSLLFESYDPCKLESGILESSKRVEFTYKHRYGLIFYPHF